MLTLKEFLTFKHGNEQDLGQNSEHKKVFSAPKIYTAKGDLSKR